MYKSIIVLLSTVVLGAAVGCDVEPDDESSSSSDREEHYSNTAYLECNGEVLVDEEFDSVDECERFRDRGPWDCNGVELDFSC